MIVTSGLTKAYGRQAVLHGVSFTARAGEVTLLVGPNGAGKSTTMRILTGLARPDAGVASINGKDIVREKATAQAQFSFLPQTPAFHPRFTCRQIVEFYARLRGVSGERCRAVLDAAGLMDVADRQTRTLSGGMRQRLGIALLLLPDAPALLLDEPGISLDPGWRRRLQSMLQEQAKRGKAVLVTTHLIAEWNNTAHRCLLCRDGRIERELDPANLPEDFEEERAGGADAGSSGRNTVAIVSQSIQPRTV